MRTPAPSQHDLILVSGREMSFAYDQKAEVGGSHLLPQHLETEAGGLSGV